MWMTIRRMGRMRLRCRKRWQRSVVTVMGHSAWSVLTQNDKHAGDEDGEDEAALQKEVAKVKDHIVWKFVADQ
jgi:hypothetical protein